MSTKRIEQRARQAGRTWPPRRRVLAAGLAAGALAAACGVAVFAQGRLARDTPPAATDSTTGRMDRGWIAYSTAPANGQEPRAGGTPDEPYLTGSDIYLARAGSEPRLVAGRADGRTWNVCPAFSPDGTMLAFGVKEPEGRALRVVGVTRAGAIVRPTVRLRVAGRGDAPCPRWSSNSTRLAYREGGRVVVRRLDGAATRWRRGDPKLGDFARSGYRSLVSPDGRRVLTMYDVDGIHFAMSAVSVDPPYDAVPIVGAVRVNHPRSWPGNGDASWQPPLPGSHVSPRPA